ncbi:TIGR04222 domain-containing membrane protein [Geodermatophilus sp. SYSU D00703]
MRATSSAAASNRGGRGSATTSTLRSRTAAAFRTRAAGGTVPPTGRWVMTGPAAFPALDLYEVAFLAGGVPRVVDTALVAMVEAGRVRARSPGQLAVVEPSRRHPVEAAVLDAVGTRGHRSVDVVRWRLADDDRVRAVGRRLAAEGLVSRWSGVLRRGDRPPLRTAAGRRALRTWEPTDRALDGGSAVLVARHGRTHVTDVLLRASVFECPSSPRPPTSLGDRIRRGRGGWWEEHVPPDPF